MKWLRNLFLPRWVDLVYVSTKDLKIERRVFVDKKTKDRWVKYLKEDGYEVLLDTPVRMVWNKEGD